MNLKDWMILLTIKKEGNISKASKKLYISQPAVTTRVQKIEKELGINILYRTNNGVQLTPQGEYLAKEASTLINKVDNIENKLKRMNRPMSGTIKISAANFMMRYKLPEILAEFNSYYPEVEFEVITGRSKDMLEKLQEDTVDISFVRGDYQWSEGKHLLFKEPLCIVSKEKIDIEQLPLLNKILYKTDYKLQELIDNWWTQNFNIKSKVGVVVERTDICIEMVAAGLGYAIVPKLVAEKHPGLYTINLTDEYDQPIVRPSWMFYSSNIIKTEVIRVFIEHLKNSVGE